jgi:hypothetical protein
MSLSFREVGDMMAQVVIARRRWVNCLAEGWVDSLAEIPFRWVNYLAEGWVDSLAEIPLKWVVCLAVDKCFRNLWQH